MLIGCIRYRSGELHGSRTNPGWYCSSLLGSVLEACVGKPFSYTETRAIPHSLIAEMNRGQRIALIIAAANLLLIALFPPIDQYSIASAAVPIFAGFHFAFSIPPLAQVNGDLLTIAVLVVLSNLAIAWLLLRDRPATAQSRRLGLQNAALLFTGANLVLMLLFPPMESVFALTRAAIPTFEGFYFIFTRKPAHVIVETLLYLEVVFILTNGALLWLLFRERRPPSIEEVRAAMRQFTPR